MSRNGWVIESTFPAMGWFARIDPAKAGGEKFDSALVCWAVIESDEGPEIVGMMATDEVICANEMEGFMCYVHESEIYHTLREGIARQLDHASWKGFNQSDSEFEKGYKHAMKVAAQAVRQPSAPQAEVETKDDR